jgi:WD40 repeat protein
VAINRRGRVAASASDDGAIRLWRATSGKEGAVLKGAHPVATALALTPDGWALISGSNKATKVWGVSSVAGADK